MHKLKCAYIQTFFNGLHFLNIDIIINKNFLIDLNTLSKTQIDKIESDKKHSHQNMIL